MRRRDVLLGGVAASALARPARAQCIADAGDTNIPACGGMLRGGGAPSLDLNFTGGTLPAGSTFTRAAGPATYFDVAGVLQTAGTNVARFDYNPATLVPRGLLIEEARTNIALQSGDFTNASWTKTNCTLAAGTPGPNGATTGSAIVPNNGAIGSLQQTITSTIAPYTMSCFAKAGTQSSLLLFLPGAWWVDTVNRTVTFDLTAGSVGAVVGTGASGAIAAIGNGWYRISITATPDIAAAGTVQCPREFATGNGVAVHNYVFGAQLEAGAYPTSYIPTTTAAATRAIDNCSMPTGAWFNAAASTLAADYIIAQSPNPGTLNRDLCALSDGTFANRMVLRSVSIGANTTIFFSAIASSVLVSAALGVVTAGAASKLAASWNGTTAVGSLNGGAAVSYASGMPTGLNVLTFGNQFAGANVPLSAWIGRVRYWNSAMAAAGLQSITT